LPISKETLDEIALSEKEYQLIVERLGSRDRSLDLSERIKWRTDLKVCPYTT